MDQELTSATETTDTSSNSQAEKTFTQAELNAILAKTKSQLEKKFESKYADLGDPDQLREIVASHQKSREDYELRKGNFEKVLQEKLSVKDAEIQKRDNIIKDYKINTPLVDAAARHRAVNADQVKSLLGRNLRLSSEGEVEVVDDRGGVRYNDRGQALSVDDLVREFLDSNPHFVQATAATTMTKTNLNPGSAGAKVDVSKLDMRNPEHRKIYADYRKSNGLA